MVNRFADAVRGVLYPELGKFARAPEPVRTDENDATTPRTDANENDATINRLRILAARAIDSQEVSRAVLTVGERVVTHAGEEFTRLGIKLREHAPHFGGMIDVWRGKNVALVKSLAGRELTKLEGILATSENLRVEELRERIEKAFNVTRSKADLLARDQTLKLNGQIVQEKQVAAGIEEYVWTTSGDERVRESHQDLDGTTHRWDTPPAVDDDGRTAHPGEDYQCRCVPFPVLPELAETEAGAENED